MKILDVQNLKNIAELSETKSCDLSEAASVCLDNQGHKQYTQLEVIGEFTNKYELKWNAVTTKIRNTRADLIETTEHGAICVAALLTFELTDYKIVRQSVRGTGFDYWLGNKDDVYPFQNVARLEISGILKGTKTQVKKRINDKFKRFNKYKSMIYPTYVCVTEFSHPLAEIRIKP